jgi:hypothetical protein
VTHVQAEKIARQAGAGGARHHPDHGRATFLIIIDEDRKQFAVEGPLTNVQPWNRAVAAAQEVGRNVRGFDIAVVP